VVAGEDVGGEGLYFVFGDEFGAGGVGTFGVDAGEWVV